MGYTFPQPMRGGSTNTLDQPILRLHIPFHNRTHIYNHIVLSSVTFTTRTTRTTLYYTTMPLLVLFFHII